MDPDKLLYKVSSGKKLTAAELNAVLRALEAELKSDALNVDDVFAELTVLSKCGSPEHATIVAAAFETRDSLCAALALETVCIRWGLTGEYLERVMNFALGVPWDLDGDLRAVALEVLGRYVSEQKEIQSAVRVVDRCVSLLLRTLDSSDIEPLVLKSALRGLWFASHEIEESANAPDLKPALIDEYDFVRQWRESSSSSGDVSPPSSGTPVRSDSGSSGDRVVPATR